MFKKVSSIIIDIIFSISIGAATYALLDQNTKQDPWSVMNPSERMAYLIETDLQQLKSNNEIDTNWTRISSVKINYTSNILKSLFSQHKPNFFTVNSVEKAKQTIRMEVDVFELPDNESTQVIYQFSLFDIKTNNKIEELSRSYLLSKLNEKKPD